MGERADRVGHGTAMRRPATSSRRDVAGTLAMKKIRRCATSQASPAWRMTSAMTSAWRIAPMTARSSTTKRMSIQVQPEAPDDATDETDAIRGDIEDTRANMSSTIDAIQEKLSPQRLTEQAKDAVRDATVGRGAKYGK